MVDGVVDKGAAGGAFRIREPAGRGGAGPRLGEARAEDAVGADDIADAAGVDPFAELDVGGGEAPRSVVREVRATRARDRGDERIGIGEGEGERLDRADGFARLEGLCATAAFCSVLVKLQTTSTSSRSMTAA